MTSIQEIYSYLQGKPPAQPIQLTTIDQYLLLEIARDIKVIRSGVAAITFVVVGSVVLGLIIGLFSAVLP